MLVQEQNDRAPKIVLASTRSAARSPSPRIPVRTVRLAFHLTGPPGGRSVHHGEQQEQVPGQHKERKRLDNEERPELDVDPSGLWEGQCHLEAPGRASDQGAAAAQRFSGRSGKQHKSSRREGQSLARWPHPRRGLSVGYLSRCKRQERSSRWRQGLGLELQGRRCG